MLTPLLMNNKGPWPVLVEDIEAQALAQVTNRVMEQVWFQVWDQIWAQVRNRVTESPVTGILRCLLD